VRLDLRKTRYRPDARRFRHLPVKGHPDGSIEVVRDVPELAIQVAGRPETAAMFDRRVGKTFFVAWNRLDPLTFVQIGQDIAGQLEMALYTTVYDGFARVRAARSLEEARRVLRRKLEYLEEVEADGWVLLPYPAIAGGLQFLVDVRAGQPERIEDTAGERLGRLVGVASVGEAHRMVGCQ
jgi:hypothetical protein